MKRTWTTFLLAMAWLCLATTSHAHIARSIQIDGDFSDWQGVLLSSGNFIRDDAYNDGDPDLQADGTFDLRRFAYTWDDTNLFLYWRRGARAANDKQFVVVAYFDVDYDSALGPGDVMLVIRRDSDQMRDLGVFAYRPVGGFDPLVGDGRTMPGNSTAQVVAAVVAHTDHPQHLQVEASIAWSTLGLRPNTPLYIKPSVVSTLADDVDDVALNLPFGIRDNGDILDTGYVGLELDRDRVLGAPSPGVVDIKHAITTDGNLPHAAELTVAVSQSTRVELWSDPDGNGDPSDGSLLAVDVNGDGDYLDPGDSVSPGADTTGDGLPDTDLLDSLTPYGLVVRLSIPSSLSPGTTVTSVLSAASSHDPTVTELVTDVVRVGGLTVVPSQVRYSVPDRDVPFAHQICNNGATDETITFGPSSALGWPIDVWYAGGPAPSADVAAGRCISVLLRLTVPAGVGVGTTDLVSFDVSFVSTPSVTDRVSNSLIVSDAVVVEPDRSGFAVASTSVFYPHTIRNAESSFRTYDLSAVSNYASGVSFWSDEDGDGVPEEGQPIVVTPSLDPFGGEYQFIVQVDLPVGLLPGSVDLTQTTVTASSDPSEVASVTDQTAIRHIGTYIDAPPSIASDIFASCGRVNAFGAGLTAGTYRFRWVDSVSNLARLSPALVASPAGELFDSLNLVTSDPLGVWTLTIERNEGAAWVLVDPGGTTEFSVLGDLRPDGGVISLLSLNPGNYPLTGSLMSLTAILSNSFSLTYDDSHVEYLVYRDMNSDAMPTDGEPYMRADGVEAIYGGLQRTCRTTSLPTIRPGDNHLDTDCRELGPMTFGSAGSWSLRALWLTECGDAIAERTSRFNVGCTGTAIADAGADRLVCELDPTRLGSGPGLPGWAYTWSPADLLDDASSAEPWATTGSTVTFNMTAIDANGCGSSDNVLVLVTPAPIADAGPSRVTCSGDPVQIGTPPLGTLQYRWSPTAGLDDSTLAQPWASPQANTSYTLTVTDAGTSCAATDLAVVDVTPRPMVDAGAGGIAPATIGPGACDSGLAYSWMPATGLDDPTACNPIADPAAHTTYCLTVRDTGSGCSSVSDCVDVGVGSCSVTPTYVDELLVYRSIDDVHLAWLLNSTASGGYHVYRAEAKVDLALPPEAGLRVVDTPASPSQLTGIDAGAAAVWASGGASFYYRVVAVCSNGVTEGP